MFVAKSYDVLLLGGIIIIPKARYGPKGRAWRQKVFEKDNFTCQHCGTMDKEKLLAHHIVEWDDAPELRLDVSNGLTLCKTCHMRHHQTLSSNLPKEHVVPWNKGLKGLKIGTKKGTKFTEEHKKKLSEAKLGKKTWNTGKIGWMSDKIAKANKERCKGKTWVIDPLTNKRKWID